MTNSLKPTRVLVTGAYGLIGNIVFAHLAGRPEEYEPFGMVRRRHPSSRIEHGDFREIPDDRLRIADLSDAAGVRHAMEGIDVVVHMAADADGRSGWESVLQSNIVGVHNVFEAAREAGVGRVVFASTNQVVFGYRADEPSASAANVNSGDRAFAPVRHDQPVRPLNFYACSKVFGEALAYMYAHVHGMSCICLRIGWVTANDEVMNPTLWCSRRDIIQLVELCIRAPQELRYDLFFGQSANEHNFVDIDHAREVLGYAPQDRAEDFIHVRERADRIREEG